MAPPDWSYAEDEDGVPAGPGPRGTWLLATALLVGAVRFLRLGSWSLWHDEVLTLHEVFRVLEGDFRPLPSHPLGVASIALLVRAVGDPWPGEWLLRIVPAALGWLAIPLTYWTFAVFGDRRRAGLAALLVAASSWHLYWSQCARFYTLAQVLSLLGCGLFLRGLWHGRRARMLVGLAITLGAALAHVSSLFVLAAVCLGAVILHWLPVRLPTRSRPAFALLARWTAVVLVVTAVVAWKPWLSYVAKKEVAGLSGLAHFALTTGYFVTPLLGAAALAGAALAVARRTPQDLLVGAVTGIGLVTALGAAAFAIVTAQYVFVLLPWIAYLATAPLGQARDGGRATGLIGGAYVAVLVLPSLASVGLYFAAHLGERPRLREAYRYVWNRRGPDDLVFGMEAPVGEYYLNPGRRDLRRTEAVARLDAYNADGPAAWTRHGRRSWIVVRGEWLNAWWPQDRSAMLQLLADQCRLMEVFPLVVGTRDLTVMVYLRE